MASFETSAIDLSMRGSDGTILQANVYQLDGVENADGSLRDLSIGQLVMAICLSRATDLEAQIVSKMEALAQTSAQLEALTALDEVLIEETGDYTDVQLNTPITVDGTTYTSSTALLNAFGISTSGTFSDVVAALESKMDSFNSLSQTTLIEIQSLTSKRDDTYNLASNVLKSLNTVLIGNANNL